MLRPRVGKFSSLSGRCRCMATVHTPKSPKREGNISDAFISLSGAEKPELPDRFKQLKCDIVRGREKQISDSWVRLLRELRKENEVVARKGSQVIPKIRYSHLESDIKKNKEDIHNRGVVIVKGAIDPIEARGYKTQVEDYVRKNPSTRAFPQHDPQVFELYWTEPQLRARTSPRILEMQRQLMLSLWHSSPGARISLDTPLSYADRLRIRQPGDSAFALSPHVDGGSVERWEKDGFGRGGVYDRILEGKYELYDPWDVTGRIEAKSNLYDGLGACTVLRLWQGWLSMSHGQGGLLVNPLMRLSTSYILLRPFFRPITTHSGPEFLHESNWVLNGEAEMTSELHGAYPGHAQELSEELHSHLELDRTMVRIGEVEPGDYVAWHCDTIHSVDKVHQGPSDSSVMYIPVCPVTDLNAEYLAIQRQAFRDGTPGPDFPGGIGESQHIGRPTESMLYEWANTEGRRAMGLDSLIARPSASIGQKEVIARANAILSL